MALSGIRITDLPEDTTLISSTDNFLKIKVDNGLLKSFKVSGQTFLASFSGFNTASNAGGGIPIFNGLTPDSRGLTFNTLSGGSGIIINSDSNLISFQVYGNNFITPTMLQPNIITSSNIAPNGITNTSIASNTINYSNLYNGADQNAVQQRMAKAWVNFDGINVVNGNCNIKSSYNVQSVTRQSVGNYTVVFSSSMNDTYYAVIASANDPSGGAFVNVNTQTRPNCSIEVVRASPLAPYDVSNISVIVFGN